MKCCRKNPSIFFANRSSTATLLYFTLLASALSGCLFYCAVFAFESESVSEARNVDLVRRYLDLDTYTLLSFMSLRFFKIPFAFFWLEFYNWLLSMCTHHIHMLDAESVKFSIDFLFWPLFQLCVAHRVCQPIQPFPIQCFFPRKIHSRAAMVRVPKQYPSNWRLYLITKQKNEEKLTFLMAVNLKDAHFTIPKRKWCRNAKQTINVLNHQSRIDVLNWEKLYS